MAPTSARPSIGYGLSPEMGMFVVAGPATSFHHETLIPDAIPSSNASIGVIPLFNVSGDIDGHDYAGNRNRIPIHLWQQNQHPTGIVNNSNYNYSKKTINFETSAAAAASSGATATCQDCGNQAKKDCPHRRCRTCCKSRGLDCSTHVKSTWVPAARRRERRMVGGASSGSTSGAKKPRMISSSATATSASNSVDTGSSGHQDGSSGGGRKEAMPTEVKAPAVFKCVRVTAVGGGEDEFAYQAMVKIGGHVFKGLLYDKGLQQQQQQQPRDGGFPNLSELHLGGVGGSSGGGGVPMCVPTEVYGSSGGNTGGFLGSSIFGSK